MIEPTKSNLAPSLSSQIAVTSAFGASLFIAQAMSNDSAAIIASDSFSQSAKNTMRCIPSLYQKILILLLATVLATAADHLLIKSHLEPLNFTQTSIGCGIKILDRELNLHLADKKHVDANGTKIKISHPLSYLVIITTLIALSTLGAHKINASPVLIYALLSAFGTSIKNVNKKLPTVYTWSLLICLTTMAMTTDLLRGYSLLSKKGSTGITLGLLCKETIRHIEKIQIGDHAGDDDDEIEEHPITSDIDSTAPVEKKQKKEKLTPPIPIYQQVALTCSILSLGILCQLQSNYIHPVCESSLLKLGSRLFVNVMRQYSFSKSIPITVVSFLGILSTGMLLNLSNQYKDIGKSLYSIGLSLPVGELKVWQLGRKISSTPEEKEAIPV